MCIRNHHGIVSLAYFFLFGNHDKLNCRAIYVNREYVIHGSKSPREITGLDETQGEGGHPHQAESSMNRDRRSLVVRAAGTTSGGCGFGSHIGHDGDFSATGPNSG